MTMRTNIFRMELTPMRASVSWEGYAFNRYFSDGCGEPRLGAPRIHGELLMLGFKVSERAISCWMRRALRDSRSEEHTSELQSRLHLVCRLLLEKKKTCCCYN